MMNDRSQGETSERAMECWRRRREANAAQAAGSGEGAGGGMRVMVIQDIVYEDEAYGPHLVLQPARIETLPVVQAIPVEGGTLVRCYPAPGRVVNSFNLGDLVKVIRANGANLVEYFA